MNQVILKGNIGQDPEVKTFESGGQVAKFSLATSEKFKNRNEEQVTTTDWHNIVFYGKSVDVIQKHLHKGDQILVVGKVKYRSYDDKDGRTVYITEIIGDRFEFCGSQKESKSEQKKSEPPYESGYSDINELPDHIQEQQEASRENNDMPF